MNSGPVVHENWGIPGQSNEVYSLTRLILVKLISSNPYNAGHTYIHLYPKICNCIKRRRDMQDWDHKAQCSLGNCNPDWSIVH